MKLLHRLDVLLRRFVDIVVGVVELVVLEVSCGTRAVSNVNLDVHMSTYELAELREFVRSCL